MVALVALVGGQVEVGAIAVWLYMCMRACVSLLWYWVCIPGIYISLSFHPFSSSSLFSILQPHISLPSQDKKEKHKRRAKQNQGLSKDKDRKGI